MLICVDACIYTCFNLANKLEENEFSHGTTSTFLSWKND